MRWPIILIPLVLVGTSLAASESEPEIPSAQSSLLLHLPMDGNTVADVTGWQREVLLFGAVPGEGRYSGSFFFDGVDDYIRVEDFHYGPEFTVSFWFCSTGNEGTSYQYMFSHGPIHQPNSGSYYFVEDGHPEFPGEIKTNLLDEDDPDRAEIFNTENGLSDGEWHLYTVSVSGEGASVYIDGRLHRHADQGGDPIDPEGPIAIGTRSDFAQERCYEGYLDDVRLYGRALDMQEVRDLYREGR